MPKAGEEEEKTSIVVQSSTTPSIRPPSELTWSGNMSENWSFFKQKFKIYMVASKSEKETSDYQIALLLSVIGDRALKIYNNFQYSTGEDKHKLETVISKFDNYFIPTKNVTYERHIFFLREQNLDENIDSFVTDLRDLSSSCEFGQLTDSLIKDKLILGIRNRTLKDRLLQTKDLDLNKALEICRASETASKQLGDICSDTRSASIDVHKIASKDCKKGQHVTSRSNSFIRNRSRPTSAERLHSQTTQTHLKKGFINNNKQKFQFVCSRCGYNHAYGKCPAFGKKCAKCGVLNHFATKCKNKNVNMCNVINDSSEDDDNLFVGEIHVVSNKNKYGTVHSDSEGNQK
ncbi:uncharacterized protein LOC129003610 [Macrosteles quadrilineatus]|uniref:uncharacterized protein LOC129003610 n=1 Tax=Macrosteles quadrilineatus TaxID=74068 RepID=UPI0023E09867|nr:uncharacterized protein LOC129003610 [Macrosteles quadrilineatus]